MIRWHWFSFWCGLLILLCTWDVAAQNNLVENQDKPAFDGMSAWEQHASFRVVDFENMRLYGEPRRGELNVRARVGLSYNRMLSPNALFDSDVRFVSVYRKLRPEGEATQNYLEIKRLMIRMEELFGSSFNYLEVGRNRLKDDRSWLMDDDMDYLFIGYDRTLLDVEFGVATWLWDGRFGDDGTGRDEDQSIESTGSYYLWGRINHQWYYNHFIELSWVKEQYKRSDNFQTTYPNRVEELIQNSDLDWLTLQASGTIRQYKTEWEYWGILSWLSGEEHQQNDAIGINRKLDMDGQLGWDFGVVGRFDHNRFAVGLGVASASADFDDGLQYFRQPIIAKNKKRMLGVKKYRIFGDVLAPDLANLQIESLWMGWAVKPEFWVEGGIHHYRQLKADSTVFYSRSDLRPDGKSRDIGTALDLVLGGSLDVGKELQLNLGWFQGAEAFDEIAEKDNAYRMLLEFILRW